MSKKICMQNCDVCGAEIRKSKTGGAVYNIDDAGKLLCESCEKKRRIAAMEKMFDEPLHRQTR